MALRPPSIDPLLNVLAPRAMTSPVAAAAAYSVLATVTSFIAALFERRLLDNVEVQWGAHRLIIHPYLSNFSTILDFAILNPLMIFFLLRSRQTVIAEPLLSGNDTVADRFLHWFAAVCCAVLAVVLMVAYSQSFFYGTFFDAVVAISEQGQCFITVTGWVVLFWTGLFTYILLMGAVNQVSYVVRVCQLQPANVSYDPLHEDEAAGLRILARPAIEFNKAALVLIVIGIVFWVYDWVMHRSALTDRTMSIAVFLLIILPLFAIPIVRLHVVMCELREDLLRSLFKGGPRGLRRAGLSLTLRYRREAHSLKRLTDEIEAAEKLRTTVLSFPTWPMPTRTLVSYGAYFGSLATPLVPKLIPIISSALGLAK
jgi:hypothetical protein